MNSLEFEYYSEIIKEEGIEPIAWNNKRVKLSFAEGNTEEERKENKTDVGIFYVSAKDVETSNNGNTYTVTAYDLPSIMSEEFDTTKAGTSVEGIVNYICNLSGLKFVDGTTFSLGQIKSVDEGATNIEVLGLIAGYDGKNIRVNGNGELETYWYYDNSADTSKLYTITRGVQLLNEFTKKEVVSPLNALTSGRADENGGSVVTVGSGVSLTYENQYMTKEKLTEIFNRVKGFEYSVGSVKWRYNPRVKCGDLVRIETGNDEYVLFPVMEQTVTYDGGMNSVCESYTYESENTVMGNKSPTQKKLEVIYNGLLAEFQKQSGIINNVLKGGYYRLLQDENTKYPYGWQIANSEEILPTTKGWRWTQGGLMHSSDGFRTADRIAFTEDGHLSADMITAGSITIGALDEDTTNTITSSLSEAVTEWYVSTSPTEPIGGEWSETSPQWAENNYIWQRLKTINKKGEISYSEPSCVQGDKGSTGIRNLIRNSKTMIFESYGLVSSSISSFLTDEDGNILTDESMNRFIV